MSLTIRPDSPHVLRESHAVNELFVSFFRRDLLAFFPQGRFEEAAFGNDALPHNSGEAFRLLDPEDNEHGTLLIELFGGWYTLTPRGEARFTPHDLRLIRAIGSVLNLRYHHLFQMAHAARLELFRGGSEDHYVAAFVEPSVYDLPSGAPSRIASTIMALRMTALSTYENRRVSTGALLLGAEDDPYHVLRPTSPDALLYGPELTSLKSIHRLCDGNRTLYLVDRDGKLADVIDVRQWASTVPDDVGAVVPCARSYAPHARATRHCGHVCAVLSPNQEIKLFAGGVQAFAFAHGRWRVLDPESKFAVWARAVRNLALARVLFQSALDLAEARHGGLFVVVDNPHDAVGRLIAPHDALTEEACAGPPPELTPGDPLAKRALHYLARGRDVTALDPSLVESLAGLDGALVTARSGRLIAFGAILRHDASSLPGLTAAEGARTTAALVASRFGPVLKVSEDGIVTCYLNGARVWDL